MDETRIDAAPTPAHIFAYRAFRSVFVHSPESSPVRAPTSFNDDKENTRASLVASSRFATSSSISKRKEPERDALSLTPKRQKTIAISPTKSILKNPNILTPRRAGLRDVAVTFKDARKSVGPELVRQPFIARVRSQPELRAVSEPAIMIEELDGIVQSKGSTTQLRAVSDPVLSEDRYRNAIAEIVQDPAFDLSDYVAKTEKEVRRFMAYASKWKKQAQQWKEENAKLKASLEEAQRKNDRLRQKMALEEKEREVYDIQPTVDEDLENAVREEVGRCSERRRAPKTTTYDRKANKPDRDPDARTSRHASTRASERWGSTAQQEQDEPSEPSRQRPAKGQNSTVSCKMELPSEKPLRSTSRQKDTPHGQDMHQTTTAGTPQLQEQPKANLEIPLRPASTNLSAPANRTSITQDRQAAARARLRQKAEERNANVRLGVEPKGSEPEKQKGRVKDGSSGIDADASELNWADLG